MWQKCRPGEPGCEGAPGPAGWPQSSHLCVRGECGEPQGPSVSVVLKEKERSTGKADGSRNAPSNHQRNMNTCGKGCGFGDGVLSFRDGLENQIPVGLFCWRESRSNTRKNLSR